MKKTVILTLLLIMFIEIFSSCSKPINSEELKQGKYITDDGLAWITLQDNEIYDVKNNSSVTLKNFYIHDRIPTDATRASKIITGTYSERMTYRITYKTNYHSEYFVLAENLSTKNSYEYSLHSNVLGLANGEYVTDVRLEFPQASPGFKTVESMKIIAQVLPTVPKDYKIVNRADVGGHYMDEWETANTSVTTVAWKEDSVAVPLPKTGY